MGGARKWAEKEATAVKIAELVALFLSRPQTLPTRERVW